MPRSRIRELKIFQASQLRANPANYREHSAEQRQRMEGILAEIGWANAGAVRDLVVASRRFTDKAAARA